jgi:hypothetical protein
MECYRLAYRLPDGTVAGFKGHGEHQNAAYLDAIGHIAEAVRTFGHQIDLHLIVWDVEALPPAERRRVERDWLRPLTPAGSYGQQAGCAPSACLRPRTSSGSGPSSPSISRS